LDMLLQSFHVVDAALNVFADPTDVMAHVQRLIESNWVRQQSF
jgi:hypothetical protein